MAVSGVDIATEEKPEADINGQAESDLKANQLNAELLEKIMAVRSRVTKLSAK